MNHSIFVGYDPRETEAFAVTRRTLREHTGHLPIFPIDLPEVRRAGLYTRPTEKRNGQLWDVISDAPMSTEFAISRFLTKNLAQSGLALFMDCDMLIRGPLDDLFAYAEDDPSKAVWCVKHEHVPDNTIKMDAQQQTRYARKNWSSVMLFRCEHKSNRALTLETINSLPGRDLHRFYWLDDAEIGALPFAYNHLVGVTQASEEPVIVHFTNGTPAMAGYEDVEFAEEWRAARRRWLAENASVPGRPSTWVSADACGNGAYLR